LAAKKNVWSDEENLYAEPQRFMAIVEGPYTNEVHSFDSYCSVLFVAGASGITQPLGYIRHLLSASAQRLVAARRIKLVWVIRDPRNISWVAEWIQELWKLDAGREILGVDIYVTKPNYDPNSSVDLSAGERVKWFGGRPKMEAVVTAMLKPSNMNGGCGTLAVNGNTLSGGLAK
jgi:hypothetical protein